MAEETLLKSLMASGLGSRRQLANAIRDGHVMVNGEVVENFSHPINIEKDVILMDGKTVQGKPEPKIILMLNKPAGVLSTTRDDRGRTTIMDILPPKYRSTMLYPVGRLDKDSTGLLLVTNDGDLTYRLTHPKFEHEKEYVVAVNTKLRPDELLHIEKGIRLDDGITSPAKITEIKGYPPYNYSLTVHEGRNRQIHRMFARLGYTVRALKRIRIAQLRLGNLKEGAVREIPTKDVRHLFQI